MGVSVRIPGTGEPAVDGAHPSAHSRVWQAVRQFALVLLLTLAYFFTRGLIRGHASVAFAHARQLLAVERALHLDLEVAMQHLALAHTWLMDAANFFYLFGHLPVLIAVAVWLFWTRPAAYRWFRDAFLLSAVVGLSIYATFPVAPPRYLPGFTDTLKAAGVNLDGSSIALFYNPYAAMPSLHVGWALVAAVVVVASARAWWLRVGAALLPVLMTLTVLMTGNHFLLDVLAGCTIAVLALTASAWWIRRQAAREHVHPAIGAIAARQDIQAAIGTAAIAPASDVLARDRDPVAVPVGALPARGLVRGRRERALRSLRPLRPARGPVPPL